MLFPWGSQVSQQNFLRQLLRIHQEPPISHRTNFYPALDPDSHLRWTGAHPAICLFSSRRNRGGGIAVCNPDGAVLPVNEKLLPKAQSKQPDGAEHQWRPRIFLIDKSGASLERSWCGVEVLKWLYVSGGGLPHWFPWWCCKYVIFDWFSDHSSWDLWPR